MSGKVIKITKRSTPVKVIGREGNYQNSDLWMHESTLAEDIEDTPTSKSLYIDLQKAGNLNTSKLVKKPVQVKGKNGKVFTRMQWVDPNTGQPVHESRHADDPETHSRSKHTQEQRERVVENLYNSDGKMIRLFAHHTGLDLDKHPYYNHIIEHTLKHYDKIPSEHLSTHFPKNRAKPSPFKYTEDTDFDVASLFEGTKLEDSEIFESAYGKPDPTASEEDSYHKNLNKILKGLTVEGVQKLFTIEEKGIHAKIEEVGTYFDTALLNVTLSNSEGEYAGTIGRTIVATGNGDYEITNQEFVLNPEHHGKGIAEEYYKRSEKLWKHLAGDNEARVDVFANISIGVYAWARKGYDFYGQAERDVALREFGEFCRYSLNSNIYEVLKNCNLTADELAHSWDFANLDDGNTYDFRSLMREDDKEDESKDDIIGSGHLGKAFMLCGKTGWDGVKIL